MPALQSRVTSHTLKKKHVFWCPLCNFCLIFPNIHLPIQMNKNIIQCFFLGWFTYGCIAGNPLAYLHGFRRLQPQHVSWIVSKCGVGYIFDLRNIKTSFWYFLNGKMLLNSISTNTRKSILICSLYSL